MATENKIKHFEIFIKDMFIKNLSPEVKQKIELLKLRKSFNKEIKLIKDKWKNVIKLSNKLLVNSEKEIFNIKYKKFSSVKNKRKDFLKKTKI